MQTITLSISGMTCGHCVRSVGAALDGVPGAEVRHVGVGSAELTLGPATEPDAVLAAVREAGYDATVASAAAIGAAPAARASCCAPAPAALARANGGTCH